MIQHKRTNWEAIKSPVIPLCIGSCATAATINVCKAPAKVLFQLIFPMRLYVFKVINGFLQKQALIVKGLFNRSNLSPIVRCALHVHLTYLILNG